MPSATHQVVWHARDRPLLEGGEQGVPPEVFGQTSFTMRVSPAISLADSIRQMASTARWVADSTHEKPVPGG